MHNIKARLAILTIINLFAIAGLSTLFPSPRSTSAHASNVSSVYDQPTGRSESSHEESDGDENLPPVAPENYRSKNAALPKQAPLTGGVRFAVIGDYGNQSTQELEIADMIRSWNVDFISTVGDNNYGNGDASTIDGNIGRAFHDFIYPYVGTRGPGAPYNKFWPALGNHDWGCSGCPTPYRNYFVLPGNERYYDIAPPALGNVPQNLVHLFIVDSDTHEPDGTSATSIQGQWLQSALASSDATWKIVLLHHSPYSSSSTHGSNSWMQWPFQQWGASAVLGGHDHDYERIVLNNFPYFVNGLGGGSRYSFGSPVPGSVVRYNADWGAQLIEADADHVTFQFFTRSGTLIDTFTLTSGGSTPIPTSVASPTRTPVATSTRTSTSTRTLAPTFTRTSTAVNTPTDVPTQLTATRTSTLVPTSTATDTPAATITPTSGCQNVTWSNISNVTTIGNTIQKTGGTSSTWDAGAISTLAIRSGDGYVEATVDAINTYRMFGLSNGDNGVTHTDIDFAAYLAGSTLGIYERGVNKGSFGALAIGDVIRVAIESGVVRYYRNGALLYTSTSTPIYPLALDTSINSMLGKITNAVICGSNLGPVPTATSTPTSGCQNVAWTNIVNVTVIGNTIQKTGGTSSTWDAGAISTLAIRSGDGYVEATVDAINTYRMFGLSNGDSGVTHTDIDFAAYLAGSTLGIYERGVPKGSFGALAIGDVIRVAVESGVVKYYRNGNLVYTSASSPIYPLALDTSINSMFGRISNAVICSANLGPVGVPTVTNTSTSVLLPTLTNTPTPSRTQTQTLTPVPTPGLGVSYYVDCTDGRDTNNGTSPTTAWQTLSRANQATLDAGDSLFLKRGCIFAAPLQVRWSGNTVDGDVYVGAYATGNAPIITRNTNGADVSVTGSHVTIEDLDARATPPSRISSTDSTCPNAPVGNTQGFALESTAQYVTLRNNTATGHYAGVFIKGGSAHNRVLNNTLQGNTMMSPLDTSSNNDAGAFGVLLWGDDNEIANNTISNSDACSYDYVRDGAAVEVYGGQSNNIHHNLAFDSDAFTELGNPRSSDNTYSYNIFRSSLTRSIFLVTRGASSGYGPVYRTRVHNNTVVLTGSSSQGFVCHAGCNSNILTMRNNILQAVLKVGYADGVFNEDYDLFYGGIRQFTTGSHSIVANPMFVNQGNWNLHLQSSSPAIDIGTDLGYDHDLDDVPVPQDGDGDGQAVPDMGAYEYNP